MRLSATRRELARDIRDFCDRHCPDRTRKAQTWCNQTACPLYKYAPREVPQLDLFRIGVFEDFVLQVVHIADQLPRPFWWSSLRAEAKRHNVAPINERWWGNVTRTRSWRKRYRLTGASRPCPLSVPRNKGSAEFEWDARISSNVNDTEYSTSAA